MKGAVPGPIGRTTDPMAKRTVDAEYQCKRMPVGACGTQNSRRNQRSPEANSTSPPVNRSALAHIRVLQRLPKTHPGLDFSNSSAFLRGESSGLISESFLQTWDDSKHRAIPENGLRRVPPVRVRFVKDGVIPVKSLVNAAGGLRLWWLPFRNLIQGRSDQVYRIPKLTCSAVRNSPECDGSRRPPIRRENRLPDHQHTHLSVAMARQKLLGCGGPPQTTWSCRR
jgi:hypothetical protein